MIITRTTSINFIATISNLNNNKNKNKNHKENILGRVPWKDNPKNPKNNKNKEHKRVRKIRVKEEMDPNFMPPDDPDAIARLLCSLSHDEEHDVKTSAIVTDQMGEETKTIEQETSTTQHQTVQFLDEEGQWAYDTHSTIDETRGQAFTGDVPLDQFFSRPVKIAAYEWGTGVNFFQSFDPWDFFFTNPRVVNRINNYNLMKCKLKVKFVINGNSFHYGKLMVSYLPLPGDDPITKARALVPADLIAASQRPHVYLDPTTSTGGTITCPFFWYNDALSIPFNDVGALGRIDIFTMQELKHANGAADRCTISVYVWAEDFSIDIPTSRDAAGLTPQMGIEPQSGKGKGKKGKGKVNSSNSGDEYKARGPISTAASYVSTFANYFSNVPAIAPYAMATSTIANGIGSLATLFGYSRPNNIDKIQLYKPIGFGNLASGDAPDTCERLVLDSKQELTVDPRTVGLGATDELAIAGIACRESYLTQFEWVVGQGSDALIFNTYVTPAVHDTVVGATSTEHHFPACAFAAMPFEYWRGTMRYRFQIVSSGFHKGRLKFVWDPVLPDSDEYNINYVEVHDIGESRDFTIDIGWGAPFQWLRHQGFDGPGISNKYFDTSELILPATSTTNGVLSVYVVNELTVPNTTVNNDIKINVFVSAGEDIEFAAPTDEKIRNVSLTPLPQIGMEPQSGIESQDSTGITGAVTGDTVADDAPEQPMGEDVCLGGGSSTLNNVVYFGEKIVSFRECIKRYNYSHTWGDYSPTPQRIAARQTAFPLRRGYNSNWDPEVDGSGNKFVYSANTLMNYITPAYVGWRGSIKWKAMLVGASQDEYGYLAIARETEIVNAGTEAFSRIGNNQSDIGFAGQQALGANWSGMAANTLNLTSSCEAEIPYMKNRRFSPTKVPARFVFDSRFPYVRFMWSQNGQSGDETGSVIDAYSGPVLDTYVAAGEDFTLFFFTGAPVMYNVPTPTP